MAKKWKSNQWVMISIIILIVFAILYTKTDIFETALKGYDFVHYIQKQGKSTELLMFGTSQFIVSAPQYSALCDQEIKTNAPSPSSECWLATATFKGQEYTLKYGIDTEINEWLIVKWETDAMVDNGDLEDYDRTDKLYVQFDANKAIQFTAETEDMTLLGENAIIELEITNNIATINAIIEVKKESRLFSLVDTFAGESILEAKETSIHTGISTQKVTAKLPTLGKYNFAVTLIPIIKYSKGIYQESTSQQTISTIVVSEPVYTGQILLEEEKEGQAIPIFDSITTTATSMSTSDYIMIIIIILLSIIFIYLVYKVQIIYRRKKGK